MVWGGGASAITHAGPPVTADGSYSAGNLVYDSSDVLWLCVATGTPGTWAQVGAPSQAPVPSGDQTGATDTAALQARLSALLPGEFLQLNATGTYWINATLIIPSAVTVLGPGFATPPASFRDCQVAMPPTIKVAAGANLAAILSDAAYTGSASNPVPSSDIHIAGLILDGNAANQASGNGHGIALITQASSIVNCAVRNTFGDGIRLTDTSAAGNTTTGGTPGALNENLIVGCRIYQPGVNGIYIASQGTLGTDGYLHENVVDYNFTGTGTAIALDQAADWSVRRNHVYACQGDAFHIFRCSHTFIEDNCTDNFGQASANGVTYYGFKIQISPFGSTPITNNFAQTSEAAGAGAGTFAYFSVAAQGAGQANDVFFSGGNGCRQISATSAASTAYTFNAGAGGTMTVRGITSALTVLGTTISSVPVLANAPTFPDFRGTVQQFTPAAPNGTTSQTLIMAGLAVAVTPALTGKLRITAVAGVGTQTAVQNVTIGLRYGTGSAPANGAAVTGTRAGTDQIGRGQTVTTAWNEVVTNTGVISGLAPGTPVWIDLAFATAVSADQADIGDITIIVEEVA